MITVYVLRSLSSGMRYTGMALDAELRLGQHNSGKSKFTKAYLPWELVYSEEFPDWASARKREKFLKSSEGKKFLQSIGLFV